MSTLKSIKEVWHETAWVGVLLVLLVAMSVPGCVEIKAITGSGNTVEEEREVSGFSSVDLPPWDEGKG